jgi:hypothetical protein
VYVQDCPNAPKTGPGRTIEVLPASHLSTKPGANLPHSYSNGRLEFLRN